MKMQQLTRLPPPLAESKEHRSEIAFLRTQLEASLQRNDSLEKENQDLRKEVTRLKSQISSLRAHDIERKSLLWKKIQNSIDNENALLLTILPQKQSSSAPPEHHLIEATSLCMVPDAGAPVKERAEKVSKPPIAFLPHSLKEMNGGPKKVPPTPGPGPVSAPPPPPPPSKSLGGTTRAVHRVPEVVELYRSLTRKQVHTEGHSNLARGAPPVTLIGEIENRSTYFSTIKSQVERQGDFINFLTKEVECAALRDISDLETFVKWLDEELSSLVDERAVLKHFPQWPERKADAMREAAFTYRDLMNLDLDVTSFRDNPKEPVTRALRRMQALQDRLEGSISNMERVRESTIKRYRDFHIPWQWMLNAGLIGQMKLSSLRLAKEYMKRVATELQSNANANAMEGNLLLQGVRFAYRIHQFAGGFDEETITAFEEMKKFRHG